MRADGAEGGKTGDGQTLGCKAHGEFFGDSTCFLYSWHRMMVHRGYPAVIVRAACVVSRWYVQILFTGHVRAQRSLLCNQEGYPSAL